jgi:hypothetical protein
MRKRGRRVDAKGRSKGTERHLQLTHFLMDSPAWASLAPVEVALFVAVARRWDGFNNGRIGCGVRDAATRIHAAPNTVSRAFDVLIERGFLELKRDSSFGQKQLVREWRVTCFPIGAWDAPTARPTHDYQRWLPPEKQKPVANGVTPSLKPCTPVSNEGTRECAIVSNGVTIAAPASLNRRHPYIYQGEGACEPGVAEPSDAQRSPAEARRNRNRRIKGALAKKDAQSGSSGAPPPQRAAIAQTLKRLGSTKRMDP